MPVNKLHYIALRPIVLIGLTGVDKASGMAVTTPLHVEEMLYLVKILT